MDGVPPSDPSQLYLLLASSGNVFSLKRGSTIQPLNSNIQIKRIAFGAHPRDVLYAVSADLSIYVWITEPDIPIRQIVEVYENERWTPTQGYSNMLLPTDRHNWSDETGRVQRAKDDAQIPSTHWNWECRRWLVDENFGGRLLGPEGWTYAVDFPASYTSEKRWNSMVRRRRWIRSCRYSKTNQWAEVFPSDASEKDLSFTDVSAGGCDMSYKDRHLQISLWAVSTHGQVYVRINCSSTTGFHGSRWQNVELPEGVEVSQVACGPGSYVWAVTTTGWVLCRIGISKDDRIGTSWVLVDSPSQRAVINQISVGPDCLWAVCKDSTVWFRQGIKSTSPSGSSWVPIEDFGASCVAISRNGEVFALGAWDNNLYWRSGVSLEDPHGKRWKQLVLHQQNESSDKHSGNDPWIWISATAGFVDPNSSSWDYAQEWKEQIMDQLSQRFDKEMKSFTKFEKAVDRVSWDNLGNLSGWSTAVNSWDDCVVEVKYSTEASQDSYMSVDGKHVHLSVMFVDITAILLHEDPQGVLELWIFTPLFTRAQTPLRLSGPRSELEKWYGFLTDCYWDLLEVKDLPKTDRLWMLSPTGCPLISLGTIQNAFPSVKWISLNGHLRIVESASGITWALGQDKSIWIWIGSYKGKLGTEKRLQTDRDYIDLYENQRWNPVLGYSTAALPTDRYMWSDETGREQLSKDSFQLPSASWRWDSEWQIDFNQADGDGWQYAFDFPSYYHPQKTASDYVRRRRWFRIMKAESPAPWLPGPVNKLKSISICPGVTGGTIPVWAITADGNVLVRDKVTLESPQGDSWIDVRNPVPFIDISVGPFCVWAVASDGTAYVRNGTRDKFDGLYWFQVEKPASGASIVQVAVGADIVWAVCDDNQLYFRRDFSAAFPEGVEWVAIADNVLKVSAGLSNQMFAILQLPNQPLPVMARRTGIRFDNRAGNGWEYGIFAKDICCRNLSHL